MVILFLMLAMSAVAPKGVAYTKGEGGAIGAILLLLMIPCFLLLVLIGDGKPSRPSAAPSPPDPLPPPNNERLCREATGLFVQGFVALGELIGKALGGVWWAVRLRWLAKLPEWAQPIAWGVLAAGPPVALMIVLFRRPS